MGRKFFSSVLIIMVGLLLTTGAFAAQTQYCKDLDFDGYGDPADCEAAYEIGLVDNDGDCNDLDETINPAAVEICGDLIDNNCGGSIDEGCPTEVTGKISYCKDQDLDNYGNPYDCVNDPEPGYITNDGDCDDADPVINPGAMEICGDGIDNNCLNGVDEGCSTTDNKQYYYLDSDGDGYGDPTIWEYVVNPSVGYVSEPIDCNDQDFAINPGMTELCSTTDLTDENCSGSANEGCSYWWQDADSDSYTSGNNYYDSIQDVGYVLDSSLVSMELDCNDQDATVNPGATEIYGDLVDQNCDGEISLFADQNLETCVLEHTGGSLDPAVLASLDRLNCSMRSISDLTGMDYFPGLTYLNLGYNSISDLTTLANLTRLKYLVLYYNSISDLSPLANLTGLTSVVLRFNNITDLSPLANLTGLTSISLENNSVSDLTPLTNLKSVYFLDLSDNSISDLTPLANLTRLWYLYLDRNSISDLTPLANLQGLGTLALHGNLISDLTPLTLSSKTLLRYLTIDFNLITNLTPLTQATFPRLEHLSLRGNSISDLAPLAQVNFPSLTHLSLSENSISNLTPLAEGYFPNLYFLRLDSNFISDLTPITNLTSLTILWLENNLISNVAPLSYIPNLSYLYLGYNCITDFFPVSHVGKVFGMDQQCM